ncbi:MAG: rod shape-determining protein RodA [Pseudomonadota bacterium]
MSLLSPQYDAIPTGGRKIFYFHWPLMLLVTAAAGIGIMMLFSVSGGDFARWAEPQLTRFAMGFALMFIIAFIPIAFWRNFSIVAYILALLLLIFVEVAGVQGKGAQRWIDLGFMRLQPSEFMKITLVMILALYYSWLDPKRVSRPLWLLPPIILILIPVGLVVQQPDLGTAILLGAGGAAVMLLAGVSLWYFGIGIAGVAGAVSFVIQSRGTPYQVLKDYQYRRIETFIDPSSDPLGAGYHITQSKIALGSGGYSGRGFMEGTQSRLNFLPEKHTDFIFTTFAEEFGFLGSLSLLAIYMLILACIFVSAISNHNRYASLMTMGIGVAFFFYFAVNMLMVMGLAPVVGVPLPLVSFGGSAMLVLMGAFGLVQSAHIHKERQ